MSGFMRITLVFQLVGFALYGWLVGGVMEYKIQREQAFTSEVLLQMPARKLGEIKI